MTRIHGTAPFALLALAVLFSTTGCKSNASNDQTAATTSQGPPPDSASDPANTNLAPVSNTETAQQGAPSPADAGSYSDQSNGQGAVDSNSQGPVDDADYGEAPEDYAPQPPPALPEYQQPEAPGDDYLWTPGYWGYASAGYYWVPGVWVQAPYQGALWTPGYWGYTNGRYGFFHGYWGPHIGFYGGVNYGFGYVGAGYQGGYWNSGHFFYNRSVNNINVTVVHNVYNRNVIVNNNNRVSFNGGNGGIQLRPRPAEIAAIREPHAPPMTAQIQVQHQASVNRAAFVSVNHGRPAAAVIEKPVMADRDVHPVVSPAARNVRIPQPAAGPARATARPVEPTRAAPTAPAARPNAAPPARTEPGRPEPTRAAPARPEPARPAPARAEPARPAPARPAERPAPAPRPQEAPHAQPSPAPSRAPEHPAARPEPNAAPARPATHPAPAAKPAPQAPHEPAKPAPPKRENERPQ
jgi:WXXGXW repeat (2 copies)